MIQDNLDVEGEFYFPSIFYILTQVMIFLGYFSIRFILPGGIIFLETNTSRDHLEGGVRFP